MEIKTKIHHKRNIIHKKSNNNFHLLENIMNNQRINKIMLILIEDHINHLFCLSKIHIIKNKMMILLMMMKMKNKFSKD